MDSLATLLHRIETRRAVLGVIGLGYVGLPLAVEFGKRQFRVVGVDIDPAKVHALTNGRSYVMDVASEDVKGLVDAGVLQPTTDYGRLAGADAVSIAVPTPLRKSKDPDIGCIVAAVEGLRPHLRPGMLIVLESTTYPGTTREQVAGAVEREGYAVGRDLFVAFSPERVDPGNPRYNTHNTPKVIGGITPACTRAAQALYRAAVQTVVPVGSADEAEMVKLLENTFRAVNIGLVNEMAMMCDRMGINFWNVVRAASTKPFGFMPFHPGPGIGGHCIPLDPSYLSWKAKTFDFYSRFIELATDVNGNMPRFVAAKLARLLNRERKALNGSRVLILGVAYKADVDDTRESPALEILRLLAAEGARMAWHDPHVASLPQAPGAERIDRLTAAEVGAFDAVLMAANHKAIDADLVLGAARLIFDCRNAFPDAPNVVKL